ncbi:uncharacterized protein LOC105439744 isoform X1 [Strongylocentrotus purpuratus]|uniref:Uncharacterized protein n=1 Tax=Strongylocentrotus purpuratus TaxID=7668 RepID=A0A7M7HMJ8_STRPU|nr:uncharacterized protein LOC105439744 isoform X1 [Strongylocentrotus purpuratus]
MAFFVTTKLVLLLAFLFLEHVVQSKEYKIIVVILVFLSAFLFAFFVVWTMRNRPRNSFHLGYITPGNKATERSQKGQKSASIKEQQHTTHTNPIEGDLANYVELDDGLPLPSIGYTPSRSVCLPYIPEESAPIGTDAYDQGQTNPQVMAPITCQTMAEIEPSGNSGDIKICLTLKSSDVKVQASQREANVTRAHSDRLPVRNEYMTTPGDATRSGAGPARERSMERSLTVPRLHVTTSSDQSATVNCMTMGKNANSSRDLEHEYMPMRSVVYTDMDSVGYEY